jgi:hypothetical protein
MEESRGVHEVLVGKLEGKTRRWEDNIKLDLQDVGWEGMDSIDVAQDR